MKLKEILLDLEESFQQHNVEAPALIAQMLTAAILQVKRLELPLKLSETLSSQQLIQLSQWQERINEHEPIQYVLGETEFMGRSFHVDPRALIPRPETELLVEKILNNQQLWQRPDPIRGIDVGTGSGCIIVSLALAHPECRWIAIDVKAEALQLAQHNAGKHSIHENIDWQQGSLLHDAAEGSLDLVVSNLPYIPTKVCNELAPAVRCFEPRSALDGGEDGLALIKQLIKQSAKVLKPSGWIYLEIGYDQGHHVEALLEKAGFQQTAVTRDLAGHDRIASGIRP